TQVAVPFPEATNRVLGLKEGPGRRLLGPFDFASRLPCRKRLRELRPLVDAGLRRIDDLPGLSLKEHIVTAHVAPEHRKPGLSIEVRAGINQDAAALQVVP